MCTILNKDEGPDIFASYQDSEVFLPEDFTNCGA